MATLKLRTPGIHTEVDDEDLEWLQEWTWYANKTSGCRVSRSNYPNKPETLYMHREILKKHGHDLKGKVVDHIDGNPLNNRKSNLRACTTAENRRNSRPPNKRPSLFDQPGIKGIRKDTGKYFPSIVHNRKTYRLGIFDNITDAVEAYNKAALELQGEYARLNVLSPEIIEYENIECEWWRNGDKPFDDWLKEHPCRNTEVLRVMNNLKQIKR